MIDDIQHSRYKTECHWYSSNVNFWYSKCNLGWISTKKSRYLPNTVITPVPYPHPSPLVFSQTRKQILLLKRQTFTLQCLAILQGHIKKNITRLNLIHCCQSLKKRGETTWPTHWTWDPQWRRLSYPQKIDSLTYIYIRKRKVKLILNGVQFHL